MTRVTRMEVRVPSDEEVVAALRTAGARFAYAFGSRVDGHPRPDSDLDVAAWFGQAGGTPPPSWEVEVPANVDLLVLDRAPLYLAGRVALHGRLLFEDDPSARVAWEADTRTVYLDELPYILEMAKSYLHAIGRHGRR
jgi:predicted nucleotidyltransferase